VDPAARAGRQPDWTFATERRWSSFLRHRGEAIGVLVNLEMEGAAHVPRHLRAGIDELLQHMLRNAVEHGIETPEERLAAQKAAAGKVLVKFQQPGKGQLRMVVRDDGRGRGLGLTFLRKAVARLGGQIAVAARPDQYTEFVIDLPHEEQEESSAAVLSR
jgi:chemotaxis protein histidine kinase CheA